MDIAGEKEQVTRTLAHFGIGCVHFRPKDLLTKFESFDEYASALEDSLGEIAAIQNIEVFSDNSLENFVDGLPVPFPLIEESEYPLLAASTGVILEITLSLTIPDRTQKEILEIDEDDERQFGEIKVFFTYQFDMPLMVVFLPEESGRREMPPSDCVRLVREFLEIEMENNASCDFTIDMIGPSPFHADFILIETQAQQLPIVWKCHEQRAYDEITISIPGGLSSVDDQITYLADNLFDDFDVFYGIELQELLINDSWYCCLANVRSLEKRRRRWNKVRRIFSAFLREGDTYDLKTQIAEFRLLSMSALATINDRITGNAFIRNSPIWTYIKSERKKFPKYDIDSLEKLVDFVDHKQVHRQNIANSIVAAITGGAAGALVAWFMHSPS